MSELMNIEISDETDRVLDIYENVPYLVKCIIYKEYMRRCKMDVLTELKFMFIMSQNYSLLFDRRYRWRLYHKGQFRPSEIRSFIHRTSCYVVKSTIQTFFKNRVRFEDHIDHAYDTLKRAVKLYDIRNNRPPPFFGKFKQKLIY